MSYVHNLGNSMAYNGSDYVADTAAHTPSASHSQNPNKAAWCALVAGPAGCTISAITAGSIWSGSASLAGAVLPAGYVIRDPNITSVTLSAGAAFLIYS